MQEIDLPFDSRFLNEKSYINFTEHYKLGDPINYYLTDEGDSALGNFSSVNQSPFIGEGIILGFLNGTYDYKYDQYSIINIPLIGWLKSEKRLYSYDLKPGINKGKFLNSYPGDYMFSDCVGDLLIKKEDYNNYEVHTAGVIVMTLMYPNSIKNRSIFDVGGCKCNYCGEFFSYAEPNQADGSMKCWSCRNTFVMKKLF